MHKNSKGKIFYGMHFYPGVAQYQEPDQEPYRVFLNEDTIRAMDPTFAGRPIFVEHVDDVDPNLDNLRKDADGWVIESFYNAADGKHWVKFITVSEKAEQAIQNGMRLSNAYVPKSFKQGGLWNGVPYAKEITDATYEHLAIVENPRYEESVIMTPEQFKQYNEKNVLELKKLSNSKEHEKKGMKMSFNFFKKTKVENAIDPELQIVLKSGKTVSLQKLLNDAMADAEQEPEKKKDDSSDSKSHSVANVEHMAKMHDGSYMQVKDLVEKHKAMKDELAELKGKKEDSKEKELDLDVKEESVDAEGDLANVDEESEKEDSLENPEEAVHDEEEDKGEKKKPLQLDSEKEEDKEVKEAKKDSKKQNKIEDEKKSQAKIKAERLKNAHLKVFENSEDAPELELSADLVARGKTRYGS